MKHLLPDRVEMITLGLAAIAFAAMVYMTQAKDIWFAVASIPLNLTAMLMGMRRHWRLMDAKRAKAAEAVDELREAA